MLVTGWDRADGVASLFVAAVMLRAAWGLLRDSGQIFLEAAPRGIDVPALGARDGRRAGRLDRGRTTCHVWEVDLAASRRCPRTCSWRATTMPRRRESALETLARTTVAASPIDACVEIAMRR